MSNSQAHSLIMIFLNSFRMSEGRQKRLKYTWHWKTARTALLDIAVQSEITSGSDSDIRVHDINDNVSYIHQDHIESGNSDNEAYNNDDNDIWDYWSISGLI